MSWTDSPSIFDSFNARNLTPLDVAKTFIPPRHFDDLVKRNHSLVIGPRGSGKTTLLKMLQTPAIESWKHPKADYYRNQIDYTGVYIAADVSWGAQINNLGKGKIPDNLKDIINKSAFTTHVLLSFVEALRDRLRYGTPSDSQKKIEISKEKESILTKSLSSVWGLQPEIPNFINLKVSLRKRLLDLSSLIDIISNLHDTGKLQEHRFLHLDFIGAISIAIDIVNDFLRSPYDKWALLFDELEIAPQSIRKSLLSSLRSVDQRLLFKLSISPYNEDLQLFENSISAMAGEDYLPITLWYASSKESYDFSYTLFKKMIQDLNCRSVEPEGVFGHPPLDPEIGEHPSRLTYSPESRKIQEFRDLSKIDPSFKRYLEEKRLDLDDVRSLGENNRAQFIRKITNIVTMRVFYRTISGTQRIRSRKTQDLYTGASTLFAIVEGNPRLLIGIMSKLLSEYSDGCRKVSGARQSLEIEKAITRFRSLLRTISIYRSNSQSPKDLLYILDQIGTYFFTKLVVEDFNPEPPLTFRVDKDSDDFLCDAIGKALNAGALIYIPDSEGASTISNIRGKRFRLSYLLAPYYRLPISLGKPASLKSILRKEENAQSLLF